MELWIDLLFKNPVGLFSVITIGTTFIIILFLVTLLIRKSKSSGQ